MAWSVQGFKAYGLPTLAASGPHSNIATAMRFSEYMLCCTEACTSLHCLATASLAATEWLPLKVDARHLSSLMAPPQMLSHAWHAGSTRWQRPATQLHLIITWHVSHTTSTCTGTA